MSAREEILARIRTANASAAPAPAPIPRDYLAHVNAGVEEFIERLQAYDAETRQTSVEGIADAVATTLAHHGVRRLLAPDGLPESWLDTVVEPLRDKPPLDPHCAGGVD